jgi:hypothetical protein
LKKKKIQNDNDRETSLCAFKSLIIFPTSRNSVGAKNEKKIKKKGKLDNNSE